MVRRFLLFLVSSGLLGAGAWLVWAQLKCALCLVEGVCFFGGKFAMAGALMMCLGGYLIWDDFIIRWRSKQLRDE